ncbi:MAG TPA: EAL domain-containing protein [Frankiaceae bacterium]|nr:EAL domain-containing protein [Frankiaceae bacterium]
MSPAEVSPKEKRRRSDDVRRLPVLLAALIVCAVGLWVPLLRSHPAGSLSAGMSAWHGTVLAIGFIVLEGAQAHVEVRRQTFSITLSEAPLVVGLALTSPLVLLLARGLAMVVSEIHHRVVGVKAAVNIALVTIESGVALLLFRALHVEAITHPGAWPAVYLSILVADTVSALFVALAITLTQGRPSRRDLALFLPPYIIGGLLSASLGLLAVIALRAEPGAGVLLAMVGLLVLLSYRAYAALARRHTTLNEVNSFAQRVVGASGGGELVSLLLRDVTRLLAADSAVLWLRDPPPDVAQVLRLSVDAVGEPLPVEGGRPDLAARADAGRSVLIPRGGDDPLLDSEGIRDAVQVPLPGGERAMGMLEVRDRLGDTSTFGDDDTRLAEALAAHVATALQNDRLLERSVYDATHDALTGLPNRGLLTHRLAEVLAVGPAAVLIVDLDRFGQINDTLGGASGDEVLIQVSQRLVANAPPGATVSRVGNDEFGMLLPGIEDVGESLAMAQTVREALLEPVHVSGLALDGSGAVGVAVSPLHGRDAQLLLRRAEAALRLAKGGEPPVQSWRASLDSTDPRRLALIGELRRALERDELVLHYQPKVALQAGPGRDKPVGVVTGVEALVRWQHPVEDLLHADEFLPMAERTGLIVPLTAVVMRLALSQCRAWLDAGRRIPVAVNLSVRGLLDPQLPATIARLLTTYDLPSELLTLEITESSVMRDVPRALPVLERLARSGISLSVDDFGTGYSSLAYLRRLPVSEVKIDKSFVQDMAVDESDAAIVETILGLARHLQLRVVAEGVEDERTRDRLASMGCDIAQGYLFSRPLPAEKFTTWLAMREQPLRRGPIRLVGG